MVRLLLIASLCIACCGASRNAMVKLSGQLCSALFVHFKQVTMMYQKCLSMPLRTWGRAKFCEGCKPGDQVFNTHYPTVELKKKSHVLEQFKRRRQSAPAQPSTHSLSGHTSDWLWARFEQPPLPPPPSSSSPLSLASLEGCEKWECTSHTWLCNIKSVANLRGTVCQMFLQAATLESRIFFCKITLRPASRRGQRALHTNNSTPAKQCKRLRRCEHVATG